MHYASQFPLVICTCHLRKRFRSCKRANAGSLRPTHLSISRNPTASVEAGGRVHTAHGRERHDEAGADERSAWPVGRCQAARQGSKPGGGRHVAGWREESDPPCKWPPSRAKPPQRTGPSAPPSICNRHFSDCLSCYRSPSPALAPHLPVPLTGRQPTHPFVIHQVSFLVGWLRVLLGCRDGSCWVPVLGFGRQSLRAF